MQLVDMIKMSSERIEQNLQMSGNQSMPYFIECPHALFFKGPSDVELTNDGEINEI